MKFLLDVNALVAALCPASPHHAAFNGWAAKLRPADLATCAITELGFIRVGSAAYGFTIGDSRKLLQAFRASGPAYIGTLPSPADRLPTWAARHGHTTDAYLCMVAQEHGLRLATFDTSIRDPAVLLL
ncbi:MAG: PIN domain-containing protein [Opitutaceae bacterium]